MEEMTKELQVFDLNEVVLAEMKGKFMQLTVADVNDSRGFDQVHEARMVVKKTRVKVEKIGLDLRRKKKAEIDDYLKLVSGTEKYWCLSKTIFSRKRISLPKKKHVSRP